MSRKANLAPESVIEAYQSGESMRSIRARLNTSVERIRHILVDAGVEIEKNRGGKRVKRGPVRLMALDYEKGMSTSALSRKYGMTRKTIYNRLKDYGVEFRNQAECRRIFSPEEEQELRRRYEEGMTTRQLAKEYCVVRDTISRAIRRAGGTLRPPGFETGYDPKRYVYFRKTTS